MLTQKISKLSKQTSNWLNKQNIIGISNKVN